MKKFALALLALVLVLGLCTVAYAAECDHADTLGNKWVEYSKDTCTAPQMLALTCGGCDKYLTQDRKVTDAAGAMKTEGVDVVQHNWIHQIDRPECGTTGTTYDYCTNCRAIANEQITAVKQHNFVAAEHKDATCTEIGTDYCADCKQTIKTADALKHDPVLLDQNKKAVTCTEDGYELWTCSRKGCTWTELKNFPKLNHKNAKGEDLHTIVTYTYNVETCTEDGHYLVKCQLCTDTQPKTVEALDHAWSVWHIDEEPTCEMKGFKSRTCTRLGCQDLRNGKPAEEVVELPALDHDIVWTVAKKATCTAEGEQFGTCARCEKTFTKPIAMIDHDWTEWTIVGDCKVHTCKVCFAVENCTECPVVPETPADPDAPAVDEDDNNSEGSGSTTGSGSDASIPATGDNTSNVPYIMMVAAVAGLVVLVASKRKVNC